MNICNTNLLNNKLLDGLFILLGGWWVWWVILSLQNAVPGLMDDGSHISLAQEYAQNGFLNATQDHIEGFFHGARFYETHFALLGIYQKLFNQNLLFWYIGNIALGVLSSVAIGYVIYSTTEGLYEALLGSFMMLTSSPVAESLRGNFGKAEAIMVMLLSVGLAFWAYSSKGHHKKIILMAGTLFFVLGSVSKESGKIVAIAMCLPWIATKLPINKKNTKSREDSASLFALFIIGVTSVFTAYLLGIPSRKSVYIKSYFEMDFSISHVIESLIIYIVECPDIITIMVMLLVPYSMLIWKKKTSDDKVLFGAACLAGCWAYFLCLLGFRFNLPYYLYVPLMLLSLSLGLGIASVSHKHRFLIGLLFAVFFISRFYSMPYLMLISKVQQITDSVNYNAMLLSQKKSIKYIYSLDIPEECQMVQEWNILRGTYNDLRNSALLYGAGAGFKSWNYQQIYRDKCHNNLSDDPTTRIKSVPQEWSIKMPNSGDCLAVRSGNIFAGKHRLRAAMPFNQDERCILDLIDMQALTRDGEWRESCSIWDPSHFTRANATYGWSFYKLNRPLGFILQDYTQDQWITRATSILIPEKSAYSKLEIEMDIPSGHAFPFRIWTESSGVILAENEVKNAGKLKQSIPIHAGELIKIQSSSWFRPNKVGLGLDGRELAARVIKIEAY